MSIYHSDFMVSKKIKIVSFVCAILVVLIHSNGYKYFPNASNLCKAVLDFCMIAVPQMSVSMFCAISGYLFFRDINNQNFVSKYKSKLCSRIKSLVVPYVAWNIIWMLFTILISKIPIIALKIDSFRLFDYSIINIVKGIFLFEYNGVGWYLFCLIVYAMMSPFLYYGLKSFRKSLFTLMLIFVICAQPYGNKYLYYLLHFNSLFFYVIGAFSALYGKQFIQRKFGWKEIAFSITAFLFSSIIFHGGIENEYIAELLRLVMVISCWIIFELFLSLEIYWYMEITMFIYVFHRITQQCVNKILVLIINYIGISDCLGALLNTILGVIITIMLSIGIAFILINFCKPLWLILTGYRVPKKFR